MTKIKPHHHSPAQHASIAALITLLACNPAIAQVAPDAGQVLQQLPKPEIRPMPGVDDLKVEGAPLTDAAPGGQRISLSGLSFRGNTVFDEETLIDAAGDVHDRSFDLAGLQELANRISRHYRERGYPFARAFIPAQQLDDGGVLVIEIMEGRYGAVTASGQENLAKDATAFTGALRPGEPIESVRLERTTLLLNDLPGIRAIPVIRPGTARGEGDLEIRVFEEARYSGELGADNHGNRYTGKQRVRAAASANRVLRFGDALTARGLYTEEDLWFGSLTYAMPLGHNGLRAQIGALRTEYTLGKELKNLNVSGVADVYTLGLSYPVIRSPNTNLQFGADYQHKRLRTDIAGTTDRKTSRSLVLILQFDRRDTLGGGGISFGVLGWTPGRLSLASSDVDPLRTEGRFHKLNLDVARVQRLGDTFALFGRLAAQWSDRNLDSSEGMSLGGPAGVRAYPQGEGTGDHGWLAQLELRRAIDAAMPYLFFDVGGVRANARTIAPTGNDKRQIAGAGIGVRYTRNNWRFDAVSAWRTRGGKAESDSRDRNPQLWLTASYRFDSGLSLTSAARQP